MKGTSHSVEVKVCQHIAYVFSVEIIIIIVILKKLISHKFSNSNLIYLKHDLHVCWREAGAFHDKGSKT